MFKSVLTLRTSNYIIEKINQDIFLVMKILKLEILNLASLDREGGEIINFDEGALGNSNIFSIVGPTGSGKSTILDAICLALYNRAPRYPLKKGERNQKFQIFGTSEEEENHRLAPTDSRNILTRGKKEAYSKLTFQANNGKVYRAEWYVSKRRVKFTEAKNNLYKISLDNGNVKEEEEDHSNLSQIIGLDYDQFLRTVLIAQGSFSSFIKAKESERYELLEKLIGSEEQYTKISTKIKQQKETAQNEYNKIIAEFTVQEKDIIPEDELKDLKLRIEKLNDEERKYKEELTRINNEILWYELKEKLETNIETYQRDFDNIERQINNKKEEIEILNLYDASMEATALFNEVKTSEKKISDLDEALSKQKIIIREREDKIKKEEKKIEQLFQNLEKADRIIQLNRPQIIKAREIKTEIGPLKRMANEKEALKVTAEKAKLKIDKEVIENQNNIENNEKNLKLLKEALFKLQEEIKEEREIITQKLIEVDSFYLEEKKKQDSYDFLILQSEKEAAERIYAELTTAIIITKEIRERESYSEDNKIRVNILKKDNEKIIDRLKTFQLEKLTDELEILHKTYTLMTSENWERNREMLSEGSPCPLCGSLQHPYHNHKTVEKVISDMRSLIEKKSKELNNQRDEKELLEKQLAMNEGTLESISSLLKNLETELTKLYEEWQSINNKYIDWEPREEILLSVKLEINKRIEETGNKIKLFNLISERVKELQREKDKFEKEKKDFETNSSEKIRELEKKIISLNSVVEIENVKRISLLEQQEEKKNVFINSKEAFTLIQQEVTMKEIKLRELMENKDPDIYEKEIEGEKIKAEQALNSEKELISQLLQSIKEEQGKESTLSIQRENEYSYLNKKKEELLIWISNFNSYNNIQLTFDKIKELNSSKYNWPEMRIKINRIQKLYTSSETTLKNEKKIYFDHQKNKPEFDKEQLLKRKKELENQSNQELIKIRIRLQKHEMAKEEMGSMYEIRQKAELLKKEWEEIYNAIGSEGKTLRKIVQCYTLGFLIEHANAEIRKFNSRYELRQVKNSLGIRVIDHDRGDDIRDTTSLSGGETFIVSLGLALGLSSISSRNISFENLFIDEGFGTLDPETLDIVIDSLSVLQTAKGKKVGVISHTDSISERITTQIRVVKHGNSGSSHIEFYP